MSRWFRRARRCHPAVTRISTLTLTNKSGAPLPLSFTLDPTPRFPTETYDAKKKRVDMPAGNPPALPKGMPAREATSHETARITLVANATAKLTIPWDAVKMKWAPEKLKGTPPESGYPRTPAGPLTKGVYTVRVAMPLVLVFEGTDREVSAPKATITGEVRSQPDGSTTRPTNNTVLVGMSRMKKMNGRFTSRVTCFDGAAKPAVTTAVAAAASVPCSSTLTNAW